MLFQKCVDMKMCHVQFHWREIKIIIKKIRLVCQLKYSCKLLAVLCGCALKETRAANTRKYKFTKIEKHLKNDKRC